MEIRQTNTKYITCPDFLSDAVVYDVGSSATRGNRSSPPDTDGAYVIPTAMIRKNGHILAWEFEASKVGPIRVQVKVFKSKIPVTLSGKRYLQLNP